MSFWLIQLTPDNKYALIPNYWSASISVINLHTLKKEKEIQVGKSPIALQITSDGNYALVANAGSKSISIINLQTWEKERGDILLDFCPTFMQLDLYNKYAFVGNKDKFSLGRINLQTWTKEGKNLQGEKYVEDIYIGLDRKYALIPDYENSNVKIINLQTWMIEEEAINVKFEDPSIRILQNTDCSLIQNKFSSTLTILNFPWKVSPWKLDFHPFYITTFPLSAVERLKKQKQQNNLFHLQRQNRLTDITIMTFEGRN